MRRSPLRWAMVLLCGFVATATFAAEPSAASMARTLAVGGAGEDAAFIAHQRAEEALLRRERAAYPGYFRAAYARYPRIPRGTLEAIAYAQSRWHHLQPDRAPGADALHPHMPQAYGVMGLYHGAGFADQVTEGAALLRTTTDRVKRDPALNILAAAALLDRELRERGDSDGDIASIAPALTRYAGFAPTASAVQDYARASFAFDVLLALDRGVDDRGILVPERAVQWERAFAPDMLVKLGAPLVRLDVQRDKVETDAYLVDPVSERLQRKTPGEAAGIAQAASPDYGPALWVASPNYSSRDGAAIREAVVHTMQGTYAGSISWFQNPSSQVSAHYLIRSSDGQITQMVRESNKAWHASSHNPYSLGIEHEGYVDNASWYTTAMYDASSALVRTWCGRYAGIVCSTAYDGPASGGVVVLPDSVDIKGHQHLSGATHTDPGINWNWARYYDLLNPGSGTTTVLDSFESSVGHFVTSPTYSGSTTGVSTGSTATRNCSIRHDGSCSLRVELIDNAGSSAAWAVRLLSGSGNPGSNAALSRSTGRIGFWVYAAGSGMSVAVGIDDSDGTERSALRSLAANTWTYVEWPLADAAQWNAWAGGNGAITAGTVNMDAIWLFHADTGYTVNVYIDNVQYKH